MSLHAKDLFHKTAFSLEACNEKAEYLSSKIMTIKEEYEVKNILHGKCIENLWVNYWDI